MSLPNRAPWWRTQAFWSAFASAFDMSGARALDTMLSPPPRRHTETSAVEDAAPACADTTSTTMPLSDEQVRMIIARIPQRFSPRKIQRVDVEAAFAKFAPGAPLSDAQVDALVEVSRLAAQIESRELAVHEQRAWSRRFDFLLLCVMAALMAGVVIAFVAIVVSLIGTAAGLASGITAGIVAGIAVLGLLARATVTLSRMSDESFSFRLGWRTRRMPSSRRRQHDPQSERSS
ncbi:hypothetical protein [Nonomuraea sp. NPDC049480]|uniref:hypothetical protein n=1 Tax=Nonomuraea sp. NPDC049480 TaxID=3364353 RepID=UPI003791C79C